MKQDQLTIDQIMMEKQEMVQKLLDTQKQESTKVEQLYLMKSKSDSLFMENTTLKEEN